MKKLFVMLLALIMCLNLAACGSANTEKNSAEAATTQNANVIKEGEGAANSNDLAAVDSGYVMDTINIAQASLTSLDPMEGSVFHGMDEVYEFLYGFDGVGGELYAILADDTRGAFGGYDHEPDSSDYTVYIHDNIYDHNGNHITASDVAFSYTYRFENYSNSWPAFESVEAVDDTTVLFHFNRELTGVSDFAAYFYRVYVVSEQSFHDSPSSLITDMCGTGPYKFVSFTPDSELKLVKNENYWQTDETNLHQWQRANVENIVYKVIAESSQQVVALQTGQVDIVDGVDGAYIGDLTTNYNYKAYNYSSNMLMFMLPNCNPDNICSDINMRLAIFYAIDTDGCEAAYQGQTSALDVLAIDSFSDYDPAWETIDSYCTNTNVELSKQYQEAAGYNGEPITLMCMNMDMFSLAAQVIQNQLVEAGINAQLASYDGATFHSVMADPSEWDILVNCANAYDYNISFWDAVFNTAQTTNGLTKNFIDDPEWADMLDKLILEEYHTTENMTEWWQHALDNAYFMPIMQWTSNAVYSSKIEAFGMNYGNVITPGACVYAAE